MHTLGRIRYAVVFDDEKHTDIEHILAFKKISPVSINKKFNFTTLVLGHYGVVMEILKFE